MRFDTFTTNGQSPDRTRSPRVQLKGRAGEQWFDGLLRTKWVSAVRP